MSKEPISAATSISDFYDQYEKDIDRLTSEFEEDIKMDMRDINIQGMQSCIIRNMVAKSKWISRAAKYKITLSKMQNLLDRLYTATYNTVKLGDVRLKNKAEIDMQVNINVKYATNRFRVECQQTLVDLCNDAVKALSSREYAIKEINETQKIHGGMY